MKKAVEDPKLAEDNTHDHTSIMARFWIDRAFKTFRLVIILFLISYFLGIMTYISFDLANNIEKDHDPQDSSINHENFISFFKIDEYNGMNRAIIMMYFTFTSLTTVGFGDFHPRSDFERIMIAVVLLFGVAIFSLVMDNFIDILKSAKKLVQSFNDEDALSRFFGLLS